MSIERSAVISDDGVYRYRLSRHWAATGDLMAFIMLNPSTADAEVDDPTIRRCMGFARREGCAGIEVINLYAFRATHPAHLTDSARAGVDIEGRENFFHWHEVILNHRVNYVVAAWGSSAPRGVPRSVALAECDPSSLGWFCLGKTKQGHPRHPLYVKADQELVML